MSGEITEKIGDNILVLKLSAETPRRAEKFGEYVHIITDEAGDWCVGDEIEVTFRKYELFRNSDELTRITAETIAVYFACYY